MTGENTFQTRGRSNDYPYYRQVWVRVVVTLLTVSLIPLMAIGGGVFSYTFDKLESQTLDTLREQVRRHQQAIDHYLSDLETQLTLIAALYSREQLTRPGTLQAVLARLRQHDAGFTDLGLIDGQGRHLAYAGPYDALLSKNYADQPWFGAVRDQGRYISDVYLGFRRIPHFIIAVRQGEGADAWVLRATADSDRFDALVAGGPDTLKTETFIVNRQGLFQTRRADAAERLMQSEIRPDPAADGIQLTEEDDLLTLILWQQKAPWACVVQVHKSAIYAGLQRARTAVLLTFIIGSMVIVAAVLMTTGSLVGRLEAKGQSLRILDKQLRRTSYLSSSMELSMGFFREVKDILANIDTSLKWLAHDQPDLNGSDADQTLAQIAAQTHRGQRLIDRFLTFVSAEAPVITPVAVDELLDELLEFLHMELQQRRIVVSRDYRHPLNPLRSDRGKLKQVLQNILLNAVSVSPEGGRIELNVQAEPGHTTVVIRDDGPGIPPTDQERIFEPLFTTKPQGTGLGLSICRDILEKLGGSISVESRPGAGAAFTIRIPDRIDTPAG